MPRAHHAMEAHHRRIVSSPDGVAIRRLRPAHHAADHDATPARVSFLPLAPARWLAHSDRWARRDAAHDDQRAAAANRVHRKLVAVGWARVVSPPAGPNRGGLK